jgi:thymidylate synthase ThyX
MFAIISECGAIYERLAKRWLHRDSAQFIMKNCKGSQCQSREYAEQIAAALDCPCKVVKM